MCDAEWEFCADNNCRMKIFNLFRDFLDNQILIPCFFCCFNFQISVCDDYSLPLDYVKKRPSSLDPGLAECLPDNWPSPLSEHVSNTFIIIIFKKHPFTTSCTFPL